MGVKIVVNSPYEFFGVITFLIYLLGPVLKVHHVTSEVLNMVWLGVKGQKISKANYGFLNSPKE